jgi:hypothetical protein
MPNGRIVHANFATSAGQIFNPINPMMSKTMQQIDKAAMIILAGMATMFLPNRSSSSVVIVIYTILHASRDELQRSSSPALD